jgi:hypothetical protein
MLPVHRPGSAATAAYAWSVHPVGRRIYESIVTPEEQPGLPMRLAVIPEYFSACSEDRGILRVTRQTLWSGADEVPLGPS